MGAVRNLRKLSRAALLRPSPRGALPDAIEHVAQAHRAHHPGADLDMLRRAYLLAESSHRGQMRKSGEPYITHPLAVTLILAQLGAEQTTLTASLLHDTVEDTDVTLAQVRAEFGDEVCHLVDGVTKLEKVDYGAAAEPETFRKMLVATGSDVRVMSIKLADRLHNMRTLGVMRPEKQVRIAKVTSDVLIPLAERLGVQALKRELEDLVFAILLPEEHARTQELIRAHTAQPDPLTQVAARVREVLREAAIDAQVLIRPRHLVSLHRLRKKRGELGPCDFGRLMILVAEDADCYAALGELHTCFVPVMSEFKDFIAVPKFNLYQSLHTAFADQDGRVAEVLVRTRQMHQVAEAGVITLGDPHPATPADAEAEAAAGDGERVDPTRPGWLSRLLEWQSRTADPDTFWSELRDELAEDREITVYCAEPGTGASSGALPLPAGASCVDAAYALHGEAAHRCIGARVNGRLTSLATALRDADTVQLFLAPTSGTAAYAPSPEWLDHARTPAARISIRKWLAAHPPVAAADAVTVPTETPAGPVPESVPEPVTEATAPAAHGATAPPGDSVSIVTPHPHAPVRLARCCTPVPPDAVTGFPVRGGAVTVHRDSCQAVVRMAAAGRSSVSVRWRKLQAGCRVTLRAEAFGRPRLLADLTETIASEGAAVVSADVEPPCEQRVRHTYTLHLPDATGLPALMRAMRKVPGVYDVSRAAHRVPMGSTG
ncbi:HD domain-containing protein [Streptomyces sp. Z26]|uniref:RelA/SpoT family protein n=1 Tax=Streptomyces sp. Z26 TaxID=2500177 RepID=UPI000EF158AB|nr:HD domain-containing protein [Streptomyces sp. Z26]RLL69198.1 bifunctional (p)ppGpp synthetase/guanosine-3',5'-bis(diphosphate) 3'-pyrophosphohydrolase [Streptomyces sp. Z26]